MRKIMNGKNWIVMTHGNQLLSEVKHITSRRMDYIVGRNAHLLNHLKPLYNNEDIIKKPYIVFMCYLNNQKLFHKR